MSNTIQFLFAVAQILLGIATCALAFFVWRLSKQMARADYVRTLQELWNTVNTTALSSDELLKVADEVHGIARQDDLQLRRKKWFIFIKLNALQQSFFGRETKLLDEGYARPNLDQLLRPMLKDPLVYRLTQECGYHAEFAEYCRSELEKHFPKEYKEYVAKRNAEGLATDAQPVLGPGPGYFFLNWIG